MTHDYHPSHWWDQKIGGTNHRKTVAKVTQTHGTVAR